MGVPPFPGEKKDSLDKLVDFYFVSGKTVLIVNGAYRGSEATLQSLNEEKFCCTVTIKQVSMYAIEREWLVMLKWYYSSYS